MRKLKIVLAITALLYGGAAFAVYSFQEVLLFPDQGRALAACNLPEGVEIWEQDGEQGLIAAKDNPNLAVFFHGNAETACNWRFLGVNHLNPLGYDVLVVEFPGYAGDARPTSKAGMEAANYVVANWIAVQNYQHVAVMGYSIGTGAASLYVRDYPADQLILYAPYDSIYNVAWGQGLYFPRAVLKHDFDNVRALGATTLPISVVYGTRDETILPARTQTLLNSLQENGREVQSFLIPNGTHGSLFNSPLFDEQLAEMLLYMPEG